MEAISSTLNIKPLKIIFCKKEKKNLTIPDFHNDKGH